MQKNIPFSKETIQSIIAKYPTPFHIYDERAMIENAKNLQKAFSWNTGFKEFFAVKATPNPYLVKLFSKIGFGADCSSHAELVLSEKTGVVGENIMFTSNNTAAYEYQKARELGAIINLDDISHIAFLEEVAGIPDIISFRYNPGELKSGNDIIGNPEEAKYGLTEAQIFEAYKIMKDKGVTRFGIHTMVASNELNSQYFIETADIMFSLMIKLNKQLGITFEFVNLGGGVGIPYKPEQNAVDIEYISKGIQKKYTEILVQNNLAPVKLYLELGRYITGPYAYLITQVQHFKDTYRKYVGVDASMANLMRPGMYGAYHHITVLGKENAPATHIYDVTGSLCENNDKFAIQRALPEIEKHDILAIHDTGAHGHAMGFNYNGKLQSAELLLRTDGSVKCIRRAETLDDYFATLDFDGLSSF
ncbi:MAG: diaminopimelate decarboxylase [Bacteroidales bacterium]|jgi:diaminopimelate decarboxylase|nr:diaminopimelate decarboxylase [Bacteroidales bacterium]HPY83018.1 diaminopimelate decarboxylase [Bacteroidales bacterium]